MERHACLNNQLVTLIYHEITFLELEAYTKSKVGWNPLVTLLGQDELSGCLIGLANLVARSQI